MQIVLEVPLQYSNVHWPAERGLGFRVQYLSAAVDCRALLKSGDHVICVHPAYQSLYEIAQNIGCAVDFWQLRSDDGTGRLHFYVSPLVEPSILSL